MLIASEHTRPRARTKRRSAMPPRGRAIVAVTLAVLVIAAVIVLVQARSSGAALFTAMLVNGAAAPLAHGLRRGSDRDQAALSR